jgi:predicted nucleic acid-binding Zn ribbon protein
LSRTKNDTTLGDAILRFLKNNKLYGRYLEEEVRASWPEVMGVAIARHTKDLYMDHGVLIVKLDSAVLRSELEMGKELIVRRLNERVGNQVINTLKFQ